MAAGQPSVSMTDPVHLLHGVEGCAQRSRTPARRVSEYEGMEIRPGVQLDDAALASFVARHAIRRLALYGSVLRDDFRPDSDIDVLVEFEPGRSPGLLALAAMELELGDLVGSEVELRTYGDLSRFFRDRVRETARELYAA
jgi:uncharacterized protein